VQLRPTAHGLAVDDCSERPDLPLRPRDVVTALNGVSTAGWSQNDLIDQSMGMPLPIAFVALRGSGNGYTEASPESGVPDPEKMVERVHRALGAELHKRGLLGRGMADVRTVYSRFKRTKKSGATLMNMRIDVHKRGVGTVVDLEKRAGRATRHVVQFDNGPRQALRLSKDPNNPKARGVKFYVLTDQTTQRQALTGVQDTNTVYSEIKRTGQSGHSLVNLRILVVGKGHGKVVDIVTARGRSTKHVVRFDDGTCETLNLSKNPNNPKSKGYKFYVLPDQAANPQGAGGTSSADHSPI